MNTHTDAHGGVWALPEGVSVRLEEGSGRFLIDTGRSVVAYGDEYTALVFAQHLPPKRVDVDEALVEAFKTVYDVAEECYEQSAMEEIDNLAQMWLSSVEYSMFTGD